MKSLSLLVSMWPFVPYAFFNELETMEMWKRTSLAGYLFSYRQYNLQVNKEKTMKMFEHIEQRCSLYENDYDGNERHAWGLNRKREVWKSRRNGGWGAIPSKDTRAYLATAAADKQSLFLIYKCVLMMLGVLFTSLFATVSQAKHSRILKADP